MRRGAGSTPWLCKVFPLGLFSRPAISSLPASTASTVKWVSLEWMTSEVPFISKDVSPQNRVFLTQ